MKFIIDRSKWACALYNPTPHSYNEILSNKLCLLGKSELLNDKGRMCCLGQMYSSQNVSDEILLNVSTPSHLLSKVSNLPDTLNWLSKKRSSPTDHMNSDIANELMVINDDEELTSEERETRLKSLVAKAGHELEFINELGV